MIAKPVIDLAALAFAAWAAFKERIGAYARVPIEQVRGHYNVAIRTDENSHLEESVKIGAAALAAKVVDKELLIRELEIPRGIDAVRITESSGLSLRLVHVYSPPCVSENEQIAVPEMWVLRLDIGSGSRA